MHCTLSQQNGMDLLYEGSDNFGALTSFGVIPAMGGLSGLITGKVPGLNIDLSKVIKFFFITSLIKFLVFLNLFTVLLFERRKKYSVCIELFLKL